MGKGNSLRYLLTAAALASAMAMPAWARTPDAPYFTRCDGYAQPDKRGDGLNSGSYLFGLAKTREDHRRGASAFLEEGVAACRKALADPLLKPEYRARRASLMQALAYHQLALFAFDDAMATVDEIDAATEGFDPVLFRRGIGIGNRLLRSFGLMREDRHGEAMAELDAIDAMRPYAMTIRNTTDSMRLMMDDRLDYQIELLRRRAPRDPGVMLDGFLLAMNFGRFDDAVVFGKGISFDLPEQRPGWSIDNAQTLDYRVIEARALVAGGVAYAMVATGDEAGAQGRIAAAREDLTTAMAPPPPRADGRKQKKSVLRDFEMRKQFGAKGGQALDAWEQTIQLRKDAAGLDLDQLKERLDALPKGSVPVVLDLVSRAEGTEKGLRAELAAYLLESYNKQRIAELQVDIFDLLRLLPHAEAPDNQIRFRRTNDGFFGGGENGYTRERMGGEDDWTIRFTDLTATAATVEEFAMLAAAQEALERGYDGLIIQTRRLLQRATRNYGMWGSYGGTSNSGREVQMRVRFVHAGALPPDLEGAEWRVLDAVQVMADLADLPEKPPR